MTWSVERGKNEGRTIQGLVICFLLFNLMYMGNKATYTFLLEINDVKLPLTVTRSQRGPHLQVIDNNNMSIIKLHYGFDKMSCLFACLYFPEII